MMLQGMVGKAVLWGDPLRWRPETRNNWETLTEWPVRWVAAATETHAR